MPYKLLSLADKNTKLYRPTVFAPMWKCNYVNSSNVCFDCKQLMTSLPRRIRNLTRNLSYRKDDRAMRPIYGMGQWVRWKISRVLTARTDTFPEICHGFLFRSILRICVQNWKFIASPVPEIIGGTEKISAVPGYAHATFSPKFLRGFSAHGRCEYTCQIWSS